MDEKGLSLAWWERIDVLGTNINRLKIIIRFFNTFPNLQF